MSVHSTPPTGDGVTFEPPRVETRRDALVERARALAAADARTLLGVTGPPGAGKSTLARKIVEWTDGAARVVGMDGFHLSTSRLARLGRRERMGAIDTFDAAGFVALLRRLREPAGETVHAPEFQRSFEEPIAGAVAIEPEARLVVVEGNYLLALQEPWNEVRGLLDEVWYSEPDEETRLANLIARHEAYGKTAEEACRWALGPDQRNAELIATTRSRADLIVQLDAVPSPSGDVLASPARTPLHALTALGQSVWIDQLSRQSIRDGELARLIEQDAVVGVTSNPTIFEQALAAGDAYEPQVRELLDVGVGDPAEIFWALAQRDVQDACDLLAPVWERTAGRDGWVSLEVDPVLADDAHGTFQEAKRLRTDVARPNLMVKIPATPAGLTAVEDAIAAGLSINVTLIFSLARYAEVAEAYLRGVERLVASGGDPAGVASVASFFVSRIDAEADRRLDAIGGPAELRGRLAIANAKLAYQHYKATFAGPRWAGLAAQGASPQRVLWASTSTKDPAYAPTRYVDELAGPGTVNTMPEATLRAYRDSGRPEARLERDLDEARATFDALARIGVDYDDLTAALERDGVERFAASFRTLLDRLERMMRASTSSARSS